MKQCPACRTTYTDDSLSYCLADGTALVTAAEPAAVRRSERDRQRAGVSPASDPTIVVPAKQPSVGRSSTKWIVLVAAGLLLGVAALAALGIAGAAFYYSSADAGPDAPPRSPTPRPTATVDAERQRLKDEIANIQKRIEDQKKGTNVAAPRPPVADDDHDQFAVTATVDSPNDGFLALRNRPDPERGERLDKIPHGAEVEIMNCEKKAVVISGRSGRWCQVEYNGQNGWVFDAWLEY